MARVKVKKKVITLIPLFFTITLASFFFLYNLGELPVRLWDESRNAVNALEMMQSGDLITRSYDEKPDMYELKPPLLPILQSALLSSLGYKELALRLPSALAGIALSVFIFLFISNHTRPLFGFLAALCFCTGLGVLGPHMFRYGDHDGLVILFLCCSMLALFRITESEHSTAYVWLFPCCVLLAVLSKSVVGLTFLPACFIWLIYRKKFAFLLRQKEFIIASLCSIAVLVAYYSLREQASPGYLNKVYNNELFRRYLNTSVDAQYENEPAWYYVKGLFDRFKPMFTFVPLFLFSVIKNWDNMNRFLSLFFFSFLAIISFGTKNFWYDGPLYPLLAMMIAYQLYGLLNSLPKAANYMKGILVIGMFYLSGVALERVLNPDDKYPKTEFYNMSYELRDYLKSDKKVQAVVLMKGYDKHLKFYIKALNAKGSELVSKQLFEVSAGDFIMFSELELEAALTKQFELEILNRGERVVTCRIGALKS